MLVLSIGRHCATKHTLYRVSKLCKFDLYHMKEHLCEYISYEEMYHIPTNTKNFDNGKSLNRAPSTSSAKLFTRIFSSPPDFSRCSADNSQSFSRVDVRSKYVTSKSIGKRNVSTRSNRQTTVPSTHGLIYIGRSFTSTQLNLLLLRFRTNRLDFVRHSR